jgi:hypothetical protein
VIVKRRLWHTADRERLVSDGDPAAAFLAYTPGQEVPDALAIELGLLPAPNRQKARSKPADKAKAADGNKAADADPHDGEV